MKIYDTQYTFIWKGGLEYEKVAERSTHLNHHHEIKNLNWLVFNTYLGISHLLKNDEPHSPSQIRQSERKSYHR